MHLFAPFEFKRRNKTCQNPLESRIQTSKSLLRPPEGQQQGAQTQNESEQVSQQEVPQDEVSVLKAALENAHHEVEKSKEVYLRLAADMENLRRRTQEDVAKAHKYAIESFAESLVPVRDSLEMALAVENQTPEALKDGVGRDFAPTGSGI
jgi:molecular chaperone GrpE